MKNNMRKLFLLPPIALVAISIATMVLVVGCTSIESEFLKLSQELERSNEKVQADAMEWQQKFVPILEDSSKYMYAGAYANTKSSTKSLVNHLDDLISTFQDSDPSDHNTPTNIMITQGKGEELANKIEFYRQQVLTMPIWDKVDEEYLSDSIPLNTYYNQENARKLKKKNWSAYHFDHVPAAAMVALLNRFKNNALKSQNLVLERIYQKATDN